MLFQNKRKYIYQYLHILFEIFKKNWHIRYRQKSNIMHSYIVPYFSQETNIRSSRLCSCNYNNNNKTHFCLGETLAMSERSHL